MSDLCSAGPAAASDPEKEIEDALLHHRIRQMGRKLLVLSGKGGVGKSTVAANLAVGLARAGKRVGLLDVDIHGPSIPKLLGVDQQQPEMVGGELRPVRVNHCLGVMSIGLLLCDAATPVIWRGPRKFGAIRQLLKDVAWGELDYLVVDSPPGTGDEPLAIAELLAGPKSCDGGCDNVQALIVTTPQDLAVADVRRCVSFCRMLNLPVAGIIENMSGFACPGCGQVIDLFKKEGGRRLAAEMGVAFLGAIPIDPCVVVGGDAGQPVVMGTGQSPAANAFSSVVQLLLKSPATSVADTAKVRLPVAGPQK
ncbi:MAG: Mrp/NBP35 family ATP-binding protein [Phycisphaerae bacterium]|jgi:ATP-binding protein involved in chromosome partitioning|nr:Mrp/NBP35 family ATP-binding protein [Phycisphaerae bacterium]HOO17938.1 Mrp/NBP35 family ATP-binding protein [Phycisphaerae bacterium]HPC23681.1 Mrp/NBP35 family ATP-binding protein [Phycisphaerae bacterium]HRS29518.1 Mrp/NBP35 family ATP-binding protein [Phycisphaerae bacterium]HRT43256.1 Mrp/NBP35 family ATP-binding protein [Phycisphaerae bacterium]